MRTLALQNNKKLILAGLIALVFLLLTQLSVQAYNYNGGWARVKTVGSSGNAWLTIGQSTSDSDLNVGMIELSEMPTVVTGLVVSSGQQLIVNGSISNMRVASSAYVRFNYSYNDLSYSNVTPWQTISSIGSFNDSIPNNSGQTVHVRAEVMVGSVSTYGSDSSLVGRASGVSGVAWVTAIVSGLLILVVTLACISYGGIYGIVLAAIVIVVGLTILGLLVIVLSTIF